jgi:hypothetical protein
MYVSFDINFGSHDRFDSSDSVDEDGFAVPRHRQAEECVATRSRIIKKNPL